MVEGGPWSADALRRRALDDLAMLAQAMHSRRRDPEYMLHALLRQAAFWREYGVPVPIEAALTTVRQLPGLAAFDPVQTWQDSLRGTGAELVEGIDPPAVDVELLKRRALVLADWLKNHAGSADAEAIVRAAERSCVRLLEACCPC